MRIITVDNGTEFHSYAVLEERLPTRFYFATPHHSRERGTRENTNGLLRQYLPKRQSMTHLTQHECNRIARKLNRRPRKRLGYRTPEECYVPRTSKLHFKVDSEHSLFGGLGTRKRLAFVPASLATLLRSWGRPATVEDVPMHSPLSAVLFPYDHVLARIDLLAFHSLQSKPANFIQGIAGSVHFDCFQCDRLDPHVHGPLPKRLDRLPPSEYVAIGRENLSVLRVDGSCGSRIAAAERSNEICNRPSDRVTNLARQHGYLPSMLGDRKRLGPPATT